MPEIKEFEFDGDFLKWVALVDPRFLNFLYGYYDSLQAFAKAGIVPPLPEPRTGQRIRLRTVRETSDVLFEAEKMLAEHDAANPKDAGRRAERARMHKLGPITADEIADFHRGITGL